MIRIATLLAVLALMTGCATHNELAKIGDTTYHSVADSYLGKGRMIAVVSERGGISSLRAVSFGKDLGTIFVEGLMSAGGSAVHGMFRDMHRKPDKHIENISVGQSTSGTSGSSSSSSAEAKAKAKAKQGQIQGQKQKQDQNQDQRQQQVNPGFWDDDDPDCYQGECD